MGIVKRLILTPANQQIWSLWAESHSVEAYATVVLCRQRSICHIDLTWSTLTGTKSISHCDCLHPRHGCVTLHCVCDFTVCLYFSMISTLRLQLSGCWHAIFFFQGIQAQTKQAHTHWLQFSGVFSTGLLSQNACFVCVRVREILLLILASCLLKRRQAPSG